MTAKTMKIEHTEDANIITGQLVLTKDTFATGLHGITGQELDEGTLEAGTWVRAVRESHTGDGVVTRFQASTDEGGTWHDQRAWERVATHYLGTEHMLAENASAQ